MKMDFHTHGELAKELPFSEVYGSWLFTEAGKAGLDAVCLTEHFNTLGFDRIYGYITENSEKDGDTFLMDGLRIFPGMETDMAEGGHILSIGPADAILELNRRLEPHKEKGSFLPFAQLLSLFREYPVMVGAGHPFRGMEEETGNIPRLPAALLSGFDFIDLNGKDLAENAQKTIDRTKSFGELLGKPVVTGSDTHQAFQYGCVHTDFAEEISTFARLREKMNAGEYTICIEPTLPFQVRTASMLKKALKQIHSLGGDYVEVLVSE